MNETALSVFRYDSKNDLIGHNVSMLVGGGDAKHHDAYLKAFHKKEKNQSQIGKQRILKAKRKDESEFPCIIGIKRSQNNKYLVGYIRDMTSIADLLGGSHKILGDENSGSLSSDEDDFVVSNVGAIDSRYKKHLRRVLDDKTFDCIVVADFYGVIQGVNATFVNEFLYRSKDELFGENLSVLIANPYIAKNHDGYLAKFREKGEQTSQIMGKQRALEAKRRDGSVFKCIVGVQAIEGVDLMVGYIRNLDTVE